MIGSSPEPVALLGSGVALMSACTHRLLPIQHRQCPTWAACLMGLQNLIR